MKLSILGKKKKKRQHGVGRDRYLNTERSSRKGQGQMRDNTLAVQIGIVLL